MRGDLYLRHRDDEIVRQPPARLRHERGHEEVERPHRTRAQVFVEGLDPDAHEGRQRAAFQPRGHLAGGGNGVPVLFGVGPVAVAVLEVEPEVLGGLTFQLGGDTRVQVGGEARLPVRTERRGECGGVGGVF